MLYHLSIEADDPRGVAHFFAEVWGGYAAPFPPVAIGSWVAFAGDDRSTVIEVYPRGTALFEMAGDADAVGLPVATHRHNATHMAIGTALDVDRIYAMCAERGWTAKYRKRGDAFGVIEVWIEGCQMVEILTEDMRREYLAALTILNWKAMLEAAAEPVPA